MSHSYILKAEKACFESKKVTVPDMKPLTFKPVEINAIK
jgi:hypothetical protein